MTIATILLGLMILCAIYLTIDRIVDEFKTRNYEPTQKNTTKALAARKVEGGAFRP